MAFVKCPKCGTKITISAFGVIKCPSCGCSIKVGTPPDAPKPGNEPPPWPLPEEPKVPMKKCKHCMSDIPINANVCPYCRRKQKGGVVKWVVLGVAGAIVFMFVALVAIGLAVGDSESELSSAQAEANSKEDSGSKAEAAKENEEKAQEDAREAENIADAKSTENIGNSPEVRPEEAPEAPEPEEQGVTGIDVVKDIN